MYEILQQLEELNGIKFYTKEEKEELCQLMIRIMKQKTPVTALVYTAHKRPKDYRVSEYIFQELSSETKEIRRNIDEDIEQNFGKVTQYISRRMHINEFVTCEFPLHFHRQQNFDVYWKDGVVTLEQDKGYTLQFERGTFG